MIRDLAALTELEAGKPRASGDDPWAGIATPAIPA